MITVAAAPEAPLVQEIPACGVLSVNPYLACGIRCVYCITGAQGRSRPRFGAETVREQLRHELGAKGHLQALVGLGTLCDAYPSVEGELGITRIVLDELTQLGWPVRVVTKGVGVRRDIDLLLRGNGRVTVSLSTLDCDAAARLEPGAPTPVEPPASGGASANTRSTARTSRHGEAPPSTRTSAGSHRSPPERPTTRSSR